MTEVDRLPSTHGRRSVDGRCATAGTPFRSGVGDRRPDLKARRPRRRGKSSSGKAAPSCNTAQPRYKHRRGTSRRRRRRHVRAATCVRVAPARRPMYCVTAEAGRASPEIVRPRPPFQDPLTVMRIHRVTPWASSSRSPRRYQSNPRFARQGPRFAQAEGTGVPAISRRVRLSRRICSETDFGRPQRRTTNNCSSTTERIEPESGEPTCKGLRRPAVIMTSGVLPQTGRSGAQEVLDQARLQRLTSWSNVCPRRRTG